MYCWDCIPSCQLTIITCSFTGACPDFQSNLPVLNVGCVKQSISQLWVKDDVVSYRASRITTTTKLPAAIWLHLETQTCNPNSNCWSHWGEEALKIRENCCMLVLCTHNQCGGMWQEKKNWFLFESHNIQVCFAVSPKKQEILAIQKEKILQKKVLQGWRLLGTPRVIPLKKSVHLYLESSDTSHSHSCHFFLWSTATSALPQSRSGKEFGYTRPAGRSTVTPRQQEKKRAFCWSFYFLLQVALKKMVQSAIITLQRSDLQENAF